VGVRIPPRPRSPSTGRAHGPRPASSRTAVRARSTGRLHGHSDAGAHSPGPALARGAPVGRRPVATDREDRAAPLTGRVRAARVGRRRHTAPSPHRRHTARRAGRRDRAMGGALDAGRGGGVRRDAAGRSDGCVHARDGARPRASPRDRPRGGVGADRVVRARGGRSGGGASSSRRSRTDDRPAVARALRSGVLDGGDQPGWFAR
jgi:hypothetical protein